MRFILQYMLYYDIKQSVEFCLCVYVRYIAVNRFLIRNGCELQNHTGSNESVCSVCEHRTECTPLSSEGRTVTVPFSLLPHIDSDDPPMAARFRAGMKLRTSVERMIKRLKCDLSDDRLKKRGNASFQAYPDKTMTAFRILLCQ